MGRLFGFIPRVAFSHEWNIQIIGTRVQNKTILHGCECTMLFLTCPSSKNIASRHRCAVKTSAILSYAIVTSQCKHTPLLWKTMQTRALPAVTTCSPTCDGTKIITWQIHGLTCKNVTYYMYHIHILSCARN